MDESRYYAGKGYGFPRLMATKAGLVIKVTGENRNTYSYIGTAVRIPKDFKGYTKLGDFSGSWDIGSFWPYGGTI